MLYLRRPDPSPVFAKKLPFNYDAATAKGFFRNHTEVLVKDWARSVNALKNWQVTKLGWCDFHALRQPHAGDVIVARASHFGFWSLHPSRIIDVVNEERRYSFTIRTLEGHNELGEERFELEWLPSGEVRFTIRSYSRPATLAGWLALPYVRHLQRRFGREVTHLMQTLA